MCQTLDLFSIFATVYAQIWFNRISARTFIFKKYFTQKFDNEGIKDSVYELYPIKEITDFPALIADIGPELVE